MVLRAKIGKKHKIQSRLVGNKKKNFFNAMQTQINTFLHKNYKRFYNKLNSYFDIAQPLGK